MRLSGKRTGRTIELGDKVRVEINNVSVIRRRIDFTLIATEAGRRAASRSSRRTRRTGPAERRTGREVERAQLHRAERGAQRGASPGPGGKLQLGVSHRKGGGKPKGKKRR